MLKIPLLKHLLSLMALILLGCNPSSKEDRLQILRIYAGAASKPPTEEIAKLFEAKNGVKVELIFGGSGYILSQMQLAKDGDIYFPGSSDFMEIAKNKKLIYPDSEKKVVYLVNSINVQKGNPHNIKTLKDLTKPNIKVAIANPEGVCVGIYAIEIIENSFSEEEKILFKKNLLNYTESCEKTATAVSLKMVDAVIGWSVFADWDPKRIESIPLSQNEISRIGYIPAAVSTFTKNKELAQEFIDFLLSPAGQKIYSKYKYFTTVNEAENYIGISKPVGGNYTVPAEWLKK